VVGPLEVKGEGESSAREVVRAAANAPAIKKRRGMQYYLGAGDVGFSRGGENRKEGLT
jgi:hypothetical protein